MTPPRSVILTRPSRRPQRREHRTRATIVLSFAHRGADRWPTRLPSRLLRPAQPARAASITAACERANLEIIALDDPPSVAGPLPHITLAPLQQPNGADHAVRDTAARSPRIHRSRSLDAPNEGRLDVIVIRGGVVAGAYAAWRSTNEGQVDPSRAEPARRPNRTIAVRSRIGGQLRSLNPSWRA
jgi:hypothetical protein